MSGEVVTTPAEQEAKRRYPVYPDEVSTLAPGIAERRAFISGAEWSESRYRELLEAAEAIRVGDWETLIDIARRNGDVPVWSDGTPRHMWDVVAEYALDGDYATDARYVYPARDRLVRLVLSGLLAAAAALEE